MKIKVKIEQEIEPVYMLADVEPRYWEDSRVNGVFDEDGKLISCVIDDFWKPKIRLSDGKIMNWRQGDTAQIHYKVCDQGLYYLLGHDYDKLVQANKDYVVNMMCPEGDGFGDYIIMNVDENGFIANWKIDFSDWGLDIID